MENIIAKIPLHETRQVSDAFIDSLDAINPSVQRPQHHGERADSMSDDEKMLKGERCVPQAKDMQSDKERLAGNIDGIATAIMEALDAVDADESTKISSIMIEIGLE